MNRRDFLKRLAGLSLGVSTLPLAFPKRVKGQVLAPITGMVGKGFLDIRVRTGLQAYKAQNPHHKIGELHCHSVYSDGYYSVDAILHRAAALGLDFVVLTEHLMAGKYPLESALESIKARRLCCERWQLKDVPPVSAYPAIEASTRQGHLLMVFPEEYLQPHNTRDIRKRFLDFEHSIPDIETAARWTRSLGGVTVVPHPNKERSYPFGVSVPFIKQNLTGLLDGIEDISAAHGIHANHSAELELAAIGSSDDHFNFLIGSAVTAYESPRHPDLIAAIRARDTHAISINNSLGGVLATARTLF